MCITELEQEKEYCVRSGLREMEKVCLPMSELEKKCDRQMERKHCVCVCEGMRGRRGV